MTEWGSPQNIPEQNRSDQMQMNDAGDWIRDCDAVRDSVQIEIPHWNQNNNNTFRGTLRRSSLSSSKEKNNNRGDGVEWGRTCSGGGPSIPSRSLGWRQPREFQLARRTTTSDHLRVAAAAAPLTWGLESTRYDSTPATKEGQRQQQQQQRKEWSVYNI